jgi:hypothetical protein
MPTEILMPRRSDSMEEGVMVARRPTDSHATIAACEVRVVTARTLAAMRTVL